MPDFDTVLRTRQSVRGYTPQPLTRALIDEVFSLAALAPSNCNVQPWQVHVVSRAVLRALGHAMTEAARSGQPPAPDVPMISRYEGPFRHRQIDAAKALYGAMGIARNDHDGRAAAFLRNLDAFGAPHAAFLFLPEGFDLREAADLGGYAQTLMLAMASRGIGSCAQGALSLYPEIVRAHLGLVQGPRLIMGIAFGYKDPDHPANAAHTDRAALADIVHHHGDT
ncbi:MAG: Nitroreductase [Rhodobacteraceae bacterium HLUCCA12]|nr:MAG: Nitroreductase [Rhodobacteraceae bacterium HLUCCA12]